MGTDLRTAAQADLISKVIRFGALRQAFADLPDGGSYTEARDILVDGDKLLAEIKAGIAALAQPEPAPTPPVALPAVVDAEAVALLRQAFRTTEVQGANSIFDQRFRMVFTFPNIGALHAADDAWISMIGSEPRRSLPGKAGPSTSAGEAIETIPMAASRGQPYGWHYQTNFLATHEDHGFTQSVDMAELLMKNDRYIVTPVYDHPAPASGASTEVQAPIPQASGEVRTLVGYMSPEQVPLVRDAEGEAGTYIPMRATPAGLFTMPLYTPPPPHLLPAGALQPQRQKRASR